MLSNFQYFLQWTSVTFIIIKQNFKWPLYLKITISSSNEKFHLVYRRIITSLNIWKINFFSFFCLLWAYPSFSNFSRWKVTYRAEIFLFKILVFRAINFFLSFNLATFHRFWYNVYFLKVLSAFLHDFLLDLLLSIFFNFHIIVNFPNILQIYRFLNLILL